MASIEASRSLASAWLLGLGQSLVRLFPDLGPLPADRLAEQNVSHGEQDHVDHEGQRGRAAKDMFISAPHARGRPRKSRLHEERKRCFRRRKTFEARYPDRNHSLSFVSPTGSGCRRAFRRPGRRPVSESGARRALCASAGSTFSTLLHLIKIVRNIQSRQNGNFCRIHRCRPVSHFLHPGIDETGQVMNVAAIAVGADAVRLAEDLDLSHAAPFLQSRH